MIPNTVTRFDRLEFNKYFWKYFVKLYNEHIIAAGFSIYKITLFVDKLIQFDTTKGHSI